MSKHWKGIISKLTPDQLLNIATIEQTELHELKQDERRAIGKNLTARGHSLFSRFDQAKLELATKLRLNTSSWREEYNDTRHFSSAFFSVLFCFFYCCFSHWKRLKGNVQFSSRIIRSVFIQFTWKIYYQPQLDELDPFKNMLNL